MNLDSFLVILIVTSNWPSWCSKNWMLTRQTSQQWVKVQKKLGPNFSSWIVVLIAFLRYCTS